MSSKLFNVYAESEYLHILNHEWEWWIQARGQGRETLFAGVGAALHIMPSPHQSAHMLRKGRTMGTSQASCLDNEWKRSDSPGMDQGRGKNISGIIWKFVSSPSDSAADCRLAILETYSEIYLSGRMRTVLLKRQYEPWNMVLFLPQPCHHSSLVPPSTKTLI